jgi:uncharacterized protein YoxC
MTLHTFLVDIAPIAAALAAVFAAYASKRRHKIDLTAQVVGTASTMIENLTSEVTRLRTYVNELEALNKVLRDEIQQVRDEFNAFRTEVRKMNAEGPNG